MYCECGEPIHQVYIQKHLWASDRTGIIEIFGHKHEPAKEVKPEEKLNCYGLTPQQWDDVCQASTDIHLKLVEVKPGEDAFDEESHILSEGLVALYKKAQEHRGRR